MIYKPFFDMNILVADTALSQLQFVLGSLMAFHVLLAAYLIYRLVVAFNKTSLRVIARVI